MNTNTTAVQIDTQLADLYAKSTLASRKIDSIFRYIHTELGNRRTEEAMARYNEAVATHQSIRDEIDKLNEQYTGWSRFFLVANAGGHIHSSRHCSTCFPTTQFSWLTDLSGQTEGEAVDAHGAILCSVCFPSAPVEWRNHWELEAAKKASASCPGSGTFNWSKTPNYSRTYPSGTCRDCGKSVSATATGKIRSHKPA